MKKNIFILCSFFLFCLPVFALEERVESNRYGVNKKWELTDERIEAAKKVPLVDANDKVYDYADILTEEEEEEFCKYFQELTEKIKMEVVFVSINMPYSRDKDNENFAADFYDYNDFGLNYKGYSGILLLRNAYEVDPYFDIYTFGDAQLLYDYNRLQVILDAIYSSFKSKNYVGGLNIYRRYIRNYFEQGLSKEALDYYVDDMGYLHKRYKAPLFFALIFSTGVTFAIIWVFISKNKMIKKATEANDYLNRQTVQLTEKEDKFITTHTTSYVVSSSSSGGGGGGFSSSSGSSGGGHSSGGGRHG